MTTNKKGYKKLPLSFNRRMVIASATVTKDKNTIHCFTEVDITEPRNLIKNHFEKTGEKLSLTALIVKCLSNVLKDYPEFNSYTRVNKLILLDDITISVLIERKIDGENVPEPIGIKQAQNMTYLEINEEIRAAKNQKTDKLGSLSDQTWIRLLPNFLLRLFVRVADKNIYMAKQYGKIAVTAVGMYSKEPIWFIPHGTSTILITIGSIDKRVVTIENMIIATYQIK